MSASTLPLTGRGIVITRPAGQAHALAELIRENGGHTILVPAIEIKGVEDRSAVDAIVARLDSYDLAIFISPNAATKGCEAVRARRSFPEHLRIAAVGPGTAAALKSLGVSAVLAPGQAADSEALLALPELQQLAGARVVIFRGVGGRELLRDTLVERGASVDYAECYRRVRPQVNVESLLRAWSAGEIDAVVVTSSEGLRNLFDLLGAAGRERLASTPVFVPHTRITATASELGLKDVVTTQPGDRGLFSALLDRFQLR